MDWTGRAANTDVNCIPSRGKSQFCLESAMSEGEGRASSESNHLARSLVVLLGAAQLAMQVIFAVFGCCDRPREYLQSFRGGAEFENLDSSVEGR